MDSLCFIIPTCCREKLHLNQLYRCLDSVRKYHNETIILIDDSTLSFSVKDYNNIFVIPSLKKGSADQQVFKIALTRASFPFFVFLQDSMILEKAIDKRGITISFLWHFTNHRLYWDNILEERSDFNDEHKIVTHTDLIQYYLNRDYKSYFQFHKFATEKLRNKNSWCGSIGNCCLFTRKAVEKMNAEIPFTNIFINYTTNRERRVNESIFALLCHYFFSEINFEKSFDGLYFDGVTVNPYHDTPTGFDNLVWCNRGKYVSKISFNR